MTSRFNGILTKGRRRSTTRRLAGTKNPAHRLVTILKSVVSGLMATLFRQKTEAYNDAENRRYGARRTGHQNLALIRRQTVILQRHYGAHRREACGADRHGLFRRPAIGKRHEPVVHDPRFLGVEPAQFVE